MIKKLPHCGILRLVNLSTRQQSVVCLRVLELYSIVRNYLLVALLLLNWVESESARQIKLY